LVKNLFQSKTSKTEEEIEVYLDIVSKATMIFYEGVKDYLFNKLDSLEERCQEISNEEKEADLKLEAIKYNLYVYMLIPDSRSDVLELLNDLDDIVDTTKQVLLQMSIEKPQIPTEIVDDFKIMTKTSLKAVDELIKATRAYFKEIKLVGNYVNKVSFYEKEADKLEAEAKRQIFNSGIVTDLSHKIHLRYFVDKCALLSDKSEEIAKNLMVYTSKREI